MSGDNKLNLVVQFSALDKLSGALKNIIGLGRSGDQALRGLKREARDLRGQMNDVAREIEGAAGNVTELAEREKALARQLARVNDQIERQKTLNEKNARYARITARGEELKSKGQDNAMGGAAMLAPFVLAGKAAMDFSSGMVDIQQKANLTNRETRAMATNILALSRAAHQLPEDMRAGVDVLAGFGLDPRQAVRMIGPIGRLGTAFKVDLADGAGAAFANLNNLKVPIGETARALDIMAASGNAGAFEVKDMARWFPALTAQMQALGQKGVPAVTDLSAALQIARRATGDADTAANNIQNLLAKIQAPATIRAFKKNFGVDLPAAMKKAYAEGKTPLEAIAELTKKVTGGDLSKIGFAFEDMQAQGALRALIQNLDDYRQMRKDIAASGGTVDAAFSQRETQDASIQWKSFTGQLQTFAIIVGAKILPSANQLLGGVNRLMGAVGGWMERNPRLAQGLVTLVGGMALARIGLGALQFSFGSVLAFIGPARAAFTVLRTAVLFLGQGFLRAGMMMLANPMVALIVGIGVAIGVVAYLVYTHWDKIKAAFSAGWNWIKSTLSGAGEWMKGIGRAMMDGLLLMLDPARLAGKLLSVAKSGITAFKNYFGIKSPSRLFMQMGGHMTEGLARGIDRGGGRPLGAMGRLATGVAGAGALALSGPAMAGSGLSSRSAPAAAPLHVEIHIHQQPGEDARALARRVAAEFEQIQRTNRRASFQDDF